MTLATALPQTATLSFKALDKTKFAVGARGAASGSIVSSGAVGQDLVTALMRTSTLQMVGGLALTVGLVVS